MRKLLVLALLLLTLSSGCKRALEKLEEDTQIRSDENPKPMVHITGTVVNPNQMLNQPNGQPAAPMGKFAPTPQAKGNPQPNPNPMPAPMGNPGTVTGNAVQSVRNAVNRTVSANELNNLRIFLENASAMNGVLPNPQETFQSVRQADPKLAGMIADGVIVLCNVRGREGVWAYDKSALQNGGMVLTNNGIERMTAQQLQQMLQQQQ